jgi:hypothetical protein
MKNSPAALTLKVGLASTLAVIAPAPWGPESGLEIRRDGLGFANMAEHPKRRTDPRHGPQALTLKVAVYG